MSRSEFSFRPGGMLRVWAAFALILSSVGGQAVGAESRIGSDETSARLRAELDKVFLTGSLAHSKVGVEVMDAETGEIVYAKNALLPQNPASNLKLLTAAAALEVLGPAYTFETSFLHDGTFKDGVIDGNLYIRGGGDPEIVYETAWKIVKNLQAQGLKRVTGNLVGDDSFFDSVRTIPDWVVDDEDDETHAYNAPLGALSVNFNTISIIVKPGEEVGQPAQTYMETPTEYVSIENRVITSRGRPGRRIAVSRATEGGREKLILEGNIQLNAGYRRFYRTITDPPNFALTIFSELMAHEGIVVEGRKLTGVTPSSAVLIFRHRSKPLDILLRYMNKLSSNFICEQLTKAMGARELGSPGTTEKGLSVIRDYLARNGIDWKDARVFNGSGLSENTRVSAHQLVSVLYHVDHDFRYRYDYFSTLPIAGIDGTLRRRMRGTAAQGYLRAKTGSVKGVFGFTGVLRTAQGRRLLFSFLVNEIHGRVSQVKEAQDRWANILVSGPGRVK